MRKGIALVCTAFILGTSGYAQPWRLGAYAYPQANFLGKNTLGMGSVKGKGFSIGGGGYFEHCILDAFAYSIGVGYTHLSNCYNPSDVAALDLTTTDKMGFISIPIIATYNFYATDNIKLGIFTGITIEQLIKAKQVVAGMEYPVDLSNQKKTYSSWLVGVNFTYLFSEEMGISIMPAYSHLFKFSDIQSASKYNGFGGQIRFFVGFGN